MTARRTWRTSDDVLLRSLKSQGLSVTEIAGVMGRTYASINHRLKTLQDAPATSALEFRQWCAENIVWRQNHVESDHQ